MIHAQWGFTECEHRKKTEGVYKRFLAGTRWLNARKWMSVMACEMAWDSFYRQS
jgi:hypothetical protein